MNQLLFLLSIFTSGLMIIAYNRLAIQRGWQTGEIYASDSGPLKFIALLSVIASFIAAFFYLQWYYVVLAVFIAWFIGTTLTSLFKSSTQLIAPLWWILSYILLFI